MVDENGPGAGFSDPAVSMANQAQLQTETNETAPLLSEDEKQKLKQQWDVIQTGFVDEPRQAVARADVLVAGAIRHLSEMFSEERAQLESQWDRGGDVSTEELRIALQRYRAFFGRLLSI